MSPPHTQKTLDSPVWNPVGDQHLNLYFLSLLQGCPNLLKSEAKYNNFQRFMSSKQMWIGWHKCLGTYYLCIRFPIFIYSICTKGMTDILYHELYHFFKRKACGSQVTVTPCLHRYISTIIELSLHFWMGYVQSDTNRRNRCVSVKGNVKNNTYTKTSIYEIYRQNMWVNYSSIHMPTAAYINYRDHSTMIFEVLHVT